MSSLTKACPTGKIRYPSPQDAWQTLRALRGRRARSTHKRRPTEGGAYQCPRCHGYHLTRSGERTPAARPWELAL